MIDVISLVAALAILVASYFVQSDDRNATQGRAQQTEPLRDDKNNVWSKNIREPTDTGHESKKTTREPETSDPGRENDDKISPWTRDDVVRDDFIRNLLDPVGRADPTGFDDSTKPDAASADNHLKDATLDVPPARGGKVRHNFGHKHVRTHRH